VTQFMPGASYTIEQSSADNIYSDGDSDGDTDSDELHWGRGLIILLVLGGMIAGLVWVVWQWIT